MRVYSRVQCGKHYRRGETEVQMGLPKGLVCRLQLGAGETVFVAAPGPSHLITCRLPPVAWSMGPNHRLST
jgi:hypothetical protein